MIVDVYNEGSQKSAVSLHFGAPPKIGDRVALEGVYFRVANAWHEPDGEWRGSKFAILLEEDSDTHGHPRFGGSWND
jgi:hypothetical protein